MLYILQAACLPSPFLSAGDLFSINVQLLTAANCTYVAVIDLHIATVAVTSKKKIVYKIAYTHFFKEIKFHYLGFIQTSLKNS